MRCDFDTFVAGLVFAVILALPACIVYHFWFDRVKEYYPITAKVLKVEFKAAHTEYYFNGKTTVPTYYSDKWEYYLESDPIGENVYSFWLTSYEDLGKLSTVNVRYGYRRMSKQIQFSW